MKYGKKRKVQPSEVREKILADHVRLRARLCEIERLAQGVANGTGDNVDALRKRGDEALADLREHMYWEDDYLGPALLEADAWGEERAKLLADDHREQRLLIDRLSANLRDRARPPLLLAWSLLDFANLLRADMQREEETLLDERVLRDDIVGIDVEAG